MSKPFRIIFVCIFSLFAVCSAAIVSHLLVQKQIDQANRKIIIFGYQQYSCIRHVNATNKKPLVPYDIKFIIDDKDANTTYYKVVYDIYLPNNNEQFDMHVDLLVDTKFDKMLDGAIFFAKRPLTRGEKLSNNKAVIKNSQDIIPAKELYAEKVGKDKFEYKYVVYVMLKDNVDTPEIKTKYSVFDLYLKFKLVKPEINKTKTKK